MFAIVSHRRGLPSRRLAGHATDDRACDAACRHQSRRRLRAPSMAAVLLLLAPSGAMLLLSPRAAAVEWFVDNAIGADAFDGRSSGRGDHVRGPLRTLEEALRRAGPGDRIHLTPNDEPYRESVSLVGQRHSGVPDRAGRERLFIIDGHGATLNGAAPIPARAWENVGGGVFRFRAPRIAWQQLFLDNRPLPRETYTRGVDGVVNLEPLTWCLHDGAIYFRVEDERLPDEYPLTFAYHTVGITLYRVHGVALVNLTVEGYQLDGIHAHDGVRDALLTGIVARGNGRSGVAAGGTSRVELVSCLLGDNGGGQLWTSELAKVEVRDSELLAGLAPAWIDRGGRVTIDGRPAAAEVP